MSVTTILGIETSCDECSAAVVRDEGGRLHVKSVATFSQVGLHRPYGGVVPEIASRNHLETVNAMIDNAIRDACMDPREIDAVAVTNRPGLVGALLVGISAGKALAYAMRRPLVAVHHLEGHATSIFLDQAPIPPRTAASEGYPMLIAVISGGHTNLYVAPAPPELWPPDFLKRSIVGRSRDDAAGEAFDKTAKVLGFPYPGGAWIDRTAAAGGNPAAFALPRALPQKASSEFSFSGLKTAVSLLAEKLRKEGTLQRNLPDVCASLQEAIVDQLITKIFRAAREHRCATLAIVGGVAANSRLRARLEAGWREAGLRQAPIFPALKYCTDNAAMIAGAGVFRFKQGFALRGEALLTLNAIANPEL